MHQPSKDLQLTSQLIRQINTVIEQCYQKAELFFNRTFNRPEIKLNLRGYNAGTATPQKNLLRFNTQLLINNQQHFLQQTVPHEVAHLIAYQVFGLKIRPHGKEWQSIMHEIYQLPADRCHHYEIDKRKKHYYIYECACDTRHPLTIRRHNAINKGSKYICKYCKGILNYTHTKTYQ